MFVELIESLRCPRPHDEAPEAPPQLVASTSRTAARHIVDGVLGCPVCGAEFVIKDSVAHFGESPPPPPPPATTAAERPDAETAMRLAAFLELTDAHGFALLCGRWGAHTDAILKLSDTMLVLVNPPPGVPADVPAGVVMARDALPFAAASARAVALDAGASAAFVASAVHAVRAGGRVIGPASLEVPSGVTELVRDATMWVGEKTAASDPTPRLVSITRAAR